MSSIGVPAILAAALLLIGADDKKPDDKAAKKPQAKINLGKDTTFVVGPLDKQGYIDYEAALNAELSRGITAEKNANVLLWQAFGPTPEGGRGMPLQFYKWLDVQPPPADGEYFMDLGKYARDRLALTDNQLNALYELQDRAAARPWKAKDNPILVEWLKFNEKPIALAVDATKRPEYFNPLCSRFDEDQQGSLIGALLPAVQKCRELARVFTTRAMMRIEEGKFDAAWQDLLACHRLGRLVGRGATLIESLVGIAICAIASNSTLTYLDRVPLTSKQLAQHLKDLQSLPAFSPMSHKIEIGERFMGLDSMQMIRRGGLKMLEGLADGEIVKVDPEDLKLVARIDWDMALRTMNKWYDRLAAAMKIEDRAAREKALEKIEKDLVARQKAVADPAKIGELIKRLKQKDPKIATDAAEALSDVLISLLSPAVHKVQYAYDRAEQTDRNLHVAFAMAAYKADNGRYPAKLDDLAPRYLAAVPNDLFSGKPLIYKPSEKGYLFYSVGQNGEDEGGRWYDDDPPGDDPRVRMPLPPLKKQD